MLKSKLIVKSNKMGGLCNRSNWSHGVVLQSGEKVRSATILSSQMFCWLRKYTVTKIADCLHLLPINLGVPYQCLLLRLAPLPQWLTLKSDFLAAWGEKSSS